MFSHDFPLAVNDVNIFLSIIIKTVLKPSYFFTSMHAKLVNEVKKVIFAKIY